MVRLVAAACLVVCALVAARPARASFWPQPADGGSRTGDIEVLFTFDDGPNVLYTPKILDILKRYDQKAVFFLLGLQVDDDSPKTKPTLLRMLREGHVIGNHTYSHKDLCRDTWIPIIGSEIDRGRNAIVKLLKIEPVWFRMPFGARCVEVETALAERHLQHFHWDLDPQEWRHGSADKTVEYITRKISESPGRSIILLHDVKGVTVRALPRIFDWIAIDNVRRLASGQKMIRILQGPEIAEERLSPGLASWALDTVGRIQSVRREIARVIP